MRTSIVLSVAAILVILGTNNEVSAAPRPCLLMQMLMPTTPAATTPTASTAATPTTPAATTPTLSPIAKMMGSIWWLPPSGSENKPSEVELVHSVKENINNEVEIIDTEPVVPKSNPPVFNNPFEELITNYIKFLTYVLTY